MLRLLKMAQISYSVLFLFICLLQIAVLGLSGLSYFPKLVTYGWRNFVELSEDRSEMLPTGKRTRYMYGIWNRCEENDLGSCEIIEAGDKMLVHEDSYEQLNVARGALIAANVLALITLVTSVWNTIKQTRISTAIHLLAALWQLACCGTSVALITDILEDASPDLEIGWALICFWVSAGIMFLIMLLSILSTCCEVTYGEYEKDTENVEKYKLEQLM